MGNAEQSCDQEGGEENEVALLRNSRTSSNVYVNQSEILSRPDNESIVNGQIIENGAGVEAKGVEHYSEEPQIEKNPRSDRPHTTQKLFVQKGCASRLQDTQERDLKDDRLSISCYQPAENLFQEHNKTYQLPREKRSTGSDLMNIEDLDTNELDIERILQVQTSHDLYCPTCNSCITRRVILCKRKRIIQLSDEEGKQRRLGTAANSKSGTSTAGATGIEGHPTDDIGVDDIHQGEPELFRCLSCFSFFIPIGNGFKLLGILGDKSAKENVPPEQIPRMKTNWFASLVTSNKKETSAEQGNSLVTDERKSNIGLIQSSDLNYLRGKSLLMQKCSSVDYVSEGIEGGNSTSESLDGRNKSDNATTKKKGQWFEAHTNNQLKDANFTIEGQPIHHSGKPVNMPSKSAKASIGDSAEDAASISQEGGSKLFSSDEEYWTLKQPENSQLPNQALQKIKEIVCQMTWKVMLDSSHPLIWITRMVTHH